MGVQRLTHKRGDTFSAACRYLKANGEPEPLDGYSIACTMRRNDLSFDFTVTILDAPQGRFHIGATAAQAAEWQPGVWRADIEYSAAGNVSSTDTFQIEVIEDITNAD